jgi:hypothetical protein
MHRITLARFTVALWVAIAVFALPMPVAAQVSTSTNTQAQLSLSVVNPCTGRTISVSGATSIAAAETIDAVGSLALRLSGVTGAIGVALPAKYVFSESDEVTLTTPAAGPVDGTFMSNLFAKGTRQSDRWILKILVTVSVDAAGQIVAASAAAAGTVCVGA